MIVGTPYQLSTATTNYTFSDLDTATNGTYVGPTNVYDPYGGWTVPTNLVTVTTVITNGALVSVTNNIPLTNNEVSVVTDPSETLEPGSNYLALANGLITRQLPRLWSGPADHPPLDDMPFWLVTQG